MEKARNDDEIERVEEYVYLCVCINNSSQPQDMGISRRAKIRAFSRNIHLFWSSSLRIVLVVYGYGARTSTVRRLAQRGVPRRLAGGEKKKQVDQEEDRIRKVDIR